MTQSAAGAAGGVLGALIFVLPLAMAEVGERDVSDGAIGVAAILGYVAGSATGVQYYSRRLGMRAPWKITLGGAAVGVIGGPFMLLTVPIGATAGFNYSRNDSSDPPAAAAP